MKWLLLTLLFTCNLVFSCELTMGYRTTDRSPFIRGAPDNRGLYLELYNLALDRIGCRLNVIRSSKSRILSWLKLGEIDFYPGFTITKKRAEYTHYINNGLPDGYAGLSRREFPDITDLTQLKGRILLVAKGGPKQLEENSGVIIKYPPELSIAHAAEMIKAKRADFYVYNFVSLVYYMKLSQDRELKLHRCCGKLYPMSLGFSKRSKHISLNDNPKFNISEPLELENQAHRLAGPSIAQQLADELLNMSKDGTTEGIYYKSSTKL